MTGTSSRPINGFGKVFIALCAVAAGLLLGSPWLGSSGAPVTQNGITVELWSPTAGSTVSNTITVSADASSLAGPIAKVEFFCDGVLFKTVTNRFASVTNLTVY